MTYNSTAIQALIDRIGWNTPVPPYTLFTVSAANLKADSGRRFNQYHKLATVEFMADTMPNPDADGAAINAYLLDLKAQAVKRTLTQIFDNNPRANYSMSSGFRKDLSGTDYSDMILTRTNVFDEVIGMNGAVIALELIKNSDRSNIRERLSKSGISSFAELEGFFNEFGKTLAKGMYSRTDVAVAKAIDILFPETDQKPSLIARRYW